MNKVLEEFGDLLTNIKLTNIKHKLTRTEILIITNDDR